MLSAKSISQVILYQKLGIKQYKRPEIIPIYMQLSYYLKSYTGTDQKKSVMKLQVKEPIEPSKEKSHKELHGFDGREYDFDKLEAELFNRNL